MTEINKMLEAFDFIFVCQKYCVASYRAFNAYYNVFKRCSVCIISNNADLPFLSTLSRYKIVDYQDYAQELGQLAIYTSPYFIYRKDSEIVKFQPAYNEEEGVEDPADHNFELLAKKLVK